MQRLNPLVQHLLSDGMIVQVRGACSLSKSIVERLLYLEAKVSTPLCVTHFQATYVVNQAHAGRIDGERWRLRDQSRQFTGRFDGWQGPHNP